MRVSGAVLREAALVAVAGCLVAFGANAISPRGLSLTRDYFPAPAPAPAPLPPPAIVAAKRSEPADLVVRRLQQRGLQAASLADVTAWFNDPHREQGLIVFVDARDDAAFRAGHVPGAWPFNHYQFQNYLPAILPAVLVAQKVVVYCGGGACEDSEFAAIMLRDAGVARENIFVFAGGFAEWSAAGRAVETGERGSGRLRASQL
jgi:rhodanese-related sulfurtransferase